MLATTSVWIANQHKTLIRNASLSSVNGICPISEHFSLPSALDMYRNGWYAYACAQYLQAQNSLFVTCSSTHSIERTLTRSHLSASITIHDLSQNGIFFVHMYPTCSFTRKNLLGELSEHTVNATVALNSEHFTNFTVIYSLVCFVDKLRAHLQIRFFSLEDQRCQRLA